MNEKIATLYQAVLDGDAEAAEQAVEAALTAGLDPAIILNDGMIAAMKQVGQMFEDGDYFVPEMLVAARAMQAGLAVLKPRLMGNEVKHAGRVVLGTVKGDLHDIGKNLVLLMLEGAGFELFDIGVDAPPDRFVAAVRQHQPQIVGMSALLTTTMPNMKATIDALESAGLRSQVKILVGGAPVTEAFAHRIGADGYAPDASRAVTVAKSLVGA
jgi:5-methyltetrahydrofolate--homocysteine methyltransferase